MTAFLLYTAQVALLIAASHTLFWTLFSHDALHRLKRFTLLGILTLCFLLPVCRITIHTQIEVVEAVGMVESSTTQKSAIVQATESAPTDWGLILLIVYLSGVCIVVTARIIGVIKVSRLIRQSSSQDLYDDIRVLVMPWDVQSFSFGRKIIVSQGDYDNHAQMIIGHELAHVKQFHFIDILLFNIALALQWFNPFMWLMRREMVLTHEYLADSEVLKNGIDAKTYQYLLISKVIPGGGIIPVVNHFRSGNLAKRVTIMRKKTGKLAILKLFILLPFVGIVITAFQEQKYDYVHSVETPGDTSAQRLFLMPFVADGKVMSQFVVGGHTGIDVVLVNDTIRSPMDGVVTLTERSGGRGNYLTVTHEGKLETSYAHLAKFLVATGAKVQAGTPIAIVGNTGRSTGVHLHFECRIDGKLVDPISVLTKALPLKGASDN